MKKQNASYTFITQLNAVRFFAAIAIVVYHYGRWSFPFSIPLIQPYVLNANTGVTLFFVLSGFIMVHVYGTALSTLNRQNIIAFYRAHIARIVPLYIMALLLTALSFYAVNMAIPIKSLLLQLFFLQSWIPNESLLINFTGWSLSVELFFYALFPFVFIIFRRLSASIQFLVVGALWLISNIITAIFAYSYFPDAELANVLIKFFPLLHLNTFFIGMFAGIWFLKSKKQIHSALIVLAISTLFVLPLLIPEGLWLILHNGLLAPAFAILIIAIVRARNLLTKSLAISPFVIGGDISYGIYILQVPIYNWTYLAYKRLGILETPCEEWRFFIYLALLCVVSWISLHTIERYGKKLIRGS